ncbi:Na+/H+ antiporter NhaA [uncultured Porphyromonas sp.]|uniref:Na+/H+ antiporter NhaA n=1 Tax=uncultured Porphyromonas sp. TaxID=159274 RepID=UPI002803EA39|nr:Na+/H+ antiporter NhaA [uncultured Porphyromonas sp.]
MSPTNRILRPIQRFTIRKVDSTVVLFLATIVALIVANSPLRDLYHNLLAIPINLNILGLDIFHYHGEPMSFLVFANDVLMVFFFFVVGLDIKQQLLVGELSSVKKAMMPVVGAIGGMIVPILLFWLIAPAGDASRGAAIPMATDIAFVLAVLMVLKDHVPVSLRVFMTTLAVADDIGGIIVIALFYSSGINLLMLGLGLAVVALLALLGRSGVRNIVIYMIGLFVVWFFFLQSGIHTTIAGVMVALTVPMTTSVSRHQLSHLAGTVSKILPHTEDAQKGQTTHLDEADLALINSLRQSASRAIPPVQRLEHALTGWVNYLILPIFAFVNAGIDFSTFAMGGISALPVAVILGLFVGKPVGIFLFTYVYIRLTKHQWSDGVYPAMLFAVSILGGIGFTVSMFIASLSYDVHLHLDWLSEAKLGILTGSLISGIVGYITVLAVGKRHQKKLAQKAN